jgi:hypothetical protein
MKYEICSPRRTLSRLVRTHQLALKQSPATGSSHEQVDQGDESGTDARGDQDIIDPEVTLDIK